MGAEPWSCPVCLEPDRPAYVFRCGHRTCDTCLEAMMRTVGSPRTCPVCRAAIAEPPVPLVDGAATLTTARRQQMDALFATALLRPSASLPAAAFNPFLESSYWPLDLGPTLSLDLAAQMEFNHRGGLDLADHGAVNVTLAEPVDLRDGWRLVEFLRPYIFADDLLVQELRSSGPHRRVILRASPLAMRHTNILDNVLRRSPYRTRQHHSDTRPRYGAMSVAAHGTPSAPALTQGSVQRLTLACLGLWLHDNSVGYRWHLVG